MKNFTAISALAAAVVLSGCASTEPGKVDMQVNTVPYEWKDDKSFAYNMAFITNKVAGVEDVDDGEQAQQEMSTVGVLGDLALGLAGGGLVGVAGQGATSANQARAYDWKPMYLIETQITDFTTDSQVIDAVDTAFSNAFSELNADYHGLYRVPNSYNSESNFVFFYSGPLCDKGRSNSAATSSTQDWSMYTEGTGDGLPSDVYICVFSVNVTVSPYVIENADAGVKKSRVIVLEHWGASRLVDYLKHRVGDYAVIPKTYGLPWEQAYDTGDAHVISSDYVHLFSTSDKAIPISEFNFK